MPAISIPSNRPLDPGLLKVLRRIHAACRAQGLAYLLTGAMAREILLVHVHGLPPGRATLDVDFGVLVQTWEAFEALKMSLINAGDFVADRSVSHRLYAVPEIVGVAMPVDLVPFGGVEAPRGSVAWPPKGEVIMDVRGYEVASRQTVSVEVCSGLVIPLPSAQGIAMMKILAWKDRGSATQGRDALDLVELLERAEDILGLDTLYDDHLNVVEARDGDLRLAASQIFGAKTRLMAGIQLSDELAGILTAGLRTSFIPQVLGGRGKGSDSDAYKAVQVIIEAFAAGLREPTESE